MEKAGAPSPVTVLAKCSSSPSKCPTLLHAPTLDTNPAAGMDKPATSLCQSPHHRLIPSQSTLDKQTKYQGPTFVSLRCVGPSPSSYKAYQSSQDRKQGEDGGQHKASDSHRKPTSDSHLLHHSQTSNLSRYRPTVATLHGTCPHQRAPQEEPSPPGPDLTYTSEELPALGVCAELPTRTAQVTSGGTGARVTPGRGGVT